MPDGAGVIGIEAALGGPPDIVYECVGKRGLIQRCIAYCRPRGTIIALGMCTPPDTILPFPLVVKELRIQTSAFYEMSAALYYLTGPRTSVDAYTKRRLGLSQLK
jgi:(R,R)-butanediol dehydrogenase / meso-butanediol dehydrogenase / diacetyl reductase